MKREYKSGTGWCAWRWTYTPSGYITRLHVLKTPWFAVMLHWINGPDPEPDKHDHPVTFLSLILRGGYTEDVLEHRSGECEVDFHGPVPHVRRWFNFIRAGEHVHRITHVRPNTLTLCFVGPKVREWGFHTAEGWIPWHEYNKKYKHRQVNAGLKRMCTERDKAMG